MARPAPLSEQLRTHLRDCGKTMYLVAQGAQVSQSAISRFLNGKRSLSLENVDRIGRFLNLEIQESFWHPTPEEKINEMRLRRCSR